MTDDLQAHQKKNEHRLGVIGGSFDPIHYGHLRIAESALRDFKLEKVIFIPAYCPPHKARPILAPFEHRSAMVRLAIEGRAHFEMSDIECRQSCPAYAGDTVAEIKKQYGRHYEFYFIIGLDSLLTLTDWDKAHTYPGLCFFIVTTRPGFTISSLEQDIPEKFLPYILTNEIPALSVSSTDIKHRIRSGLSIDGMVPDTVKDYIETFKIYTRIFT